MLLNQSDKEYILRDFPNIKLSYENIIYKKVSQADNIMVIPEGKKCFAWFTNYKGKNVCLIMELTGNKQISDIKCTNACFSNQLSYGTIFYGTVFNHSYNRFFSIEDVFYYKGNDISRENWGNKLFKLYDILSKDLKQIAYNNLYIVFGLPLICKSNEELQNSIKNIKYKISTIQFRLYNRSNSYLFMDYNKYIEDKSNYIKENKSNYIKETKSNYIKEEKSYKKEPHPQQLPYKKEIIFLIRPDIQDDIYYLYYLNNELKEEQYSVVHIPDFNTSVMMNSLFRIIKENKNLDALEESDDEDEFENNKIDKFVKLDISHKMVCKFNHKFKKWYPIRLADKKSKVVSISEFKI